MTEADARDWIAQRFGTLAMERICRLLKLVLAGNECQNLIAPSTVEEVWVRHAADSAQLTKFDRAGLWIDIGTGGGFPGLVIASLRLGDPMVLVEPRRRRAEFLQYCVDKLALGHVKVLANKVEKLTERADIVSARAVAPVEKLLHMAAGCAKEGARWLLPRGRFGDADLAALQRHWRGTFHVEHSITDPDSSILVIDEVQQR